MKRPRYLSPGDYVALIQERERQAERRRQELRSKFRLIRKPAQVYGWSELFAVHPDGESAPFPPPWVWSRPGQFWYLLVQDTEIDHHENRIRDQFERKDS